MKIIKLFLLSVFSIGLLCGQSVTEQARALQADYKAVIAPLSGQTKHVTEDAWIVSNATTIDTLAAAISDIEGTVLKTFVAARKGYKDNGYDTPAWTNVAGLLKAYAPDDYAARCATIEEVRAYLATHDAKAWAVEWAAKKRLNSPELLPLFYEAQMGHGVLDGDYQKWFMLRLDALEKAQAVAIIAAEQKALTKVTASSQRNAWLNELETAYRIYAR